MKKEYIKPEIVVEQFMAELAFLGGSDTDIEGGSPGESGDPDANERRGGWGNLWD